MKMLITTPAINEDFNTRQARKLKGVIDGLRQRGYRVFWPLEPMLTERVFLDALSGKDTVNAALDWATEAGAIVFVASEEILTGLRKATERDTMRCNDATKLIATVAELADFVLPKDRLFLYPLEVFDAETTEKIEDRFVTVAKQAKQDKRDKP